MEDVLVRAVQFFLALSGAYLLALWFALALWTYRDITSRSMNPITHIFSTLVVVLFFVPGAIIYLILRPRETLDEAFQRTMEEEYLLQDLDDIPACPVCRRSVRDDYVFCPHCSAELRHACRTCRRLVDLRWEMCPYCGAGQREQPLPGRLTIAEPDARSLTRRRSTGTLQPIDGGRAPARAPGAGDSDPATSRPADETVPSYDFSGAETSPEHATGAMPAPSNGSRPDVTRRPKSRAARDRGSGPRPGGSGS